MLETDEYIYAWTPKAADKIIKGLEQHSKLALDIETCCKQEYRAITPLKMQALDPHTGEISVMSLSAEGEKPIVLDILLLSRQSYNWAALKKLLSTREYILAQNATFELKWLYHTFKVWFTNFRCTLIAARLHANATGSKYAKLRKLGLASLCRDFLGVKLSGKGAGSEQVTDWYPRPLSLPFKFPKNLTPEIVNTINLFKEQTEVALSDLPINEHDKFLRLEWHNKLKYSAGDVVYLFKLEALLREIITGPLPYSPILYDGASEGPYGLGMHKTYEQSMKALVGFAMIEYNGLPASRELLNNIYDNVYNKHTMTGTAINIAAQLCQEFGLQTEEDWFSDGVKPSLASLKILNSPPKLNALITRLIKIGTLEKVDGLTLQRLIDLLSGIDYYSEDEYGRYQELEFIEDSDRVQCSKILKLLIDYKRLMKLKSIDLREYINPITGCIHSSVKQAAAATGRCIAKGCLVRTNQGEIPIEQIIISDMVYCCNSKGEVFCRPVSNTWVRGRKEVLKVCWESPRANRTGTIVCTPDHKFLSTDGWVEAQDLKFGSEIHCFEPGQRLCDVRTHKITRVIPAGIQPVYDIEVPEFNNFICEELCVHNSASSSPNSQNYSGRTPVEIERPLNNLFPSDAKH